MQKRMQAPRTCCELVIGDGYNFRDMEIKVAHVKLGLATVVIPKSQGLNLIRTRGGFSSKSLTNLVPKRPIHFPFPCRSEAQPEQAEHCSRIVGYIRTLASHLTIVHLPIEPIVPLPKPPNGRRVSHLHLRPPSNARPDAALQTNEDDIWSRLVCEVDPVYLCITLDAISAMKRPF